MQISWWQCRSHSTKHDCGLSNVCEKPGVLDVFGFEKRKEFASLPLPGVWIRIDLAAESSWQIQRCPPAFGRRPVCL